MGKLFHSVAMELLLNDLAGQRRKVLLALAKICLLATVLFVCDRLIDTVLRWGLVRYFGLDRAVAVACIGHSRTVLGVDGNLLEDQLGIPVAKYAVQGANTVDRFAMVRHLLARHSDTVRAVVIDVSAFTFNDDGLSSNSYRLFMPFLNEPEMGIHVRRSLTSSRELWIRQILRTSRYGEATISLAMRGHLGLHDNLKWGQLDLSRLRQRIRDGQYQKMQINPEARKAFDGMVRYVRSHGVKVVLAYIPTIDIVNDIDRAAHDQIIELLRQFAAEDPDVHFVNYNTEFQSLHKLFYDGIHVNAAGRKMVTRRLAADLKMIMQSADKSSFAQAGYFAR